jgi:hypothetical protein
MARVALINGLVHVQKVWYLDDLLLYDRCTGRLVGWITQVPQGDKLSLPRFVVTKDYSCNAMSASSFRVEVVILAAKFHLELTREDRR